MAGEVLVWGKLMPKNIFGNIKEKFHLKELEETTGKYQNRFYGDGFMEIIPSSSRCLLICLWRQDVLKIYTYFGGMAYLFIFF